MPKAGAPGKGAHGPAAIQGKEEKTQTALRQNAFKGRNRKGSTCLKKRGGNLSLNRGGARGFQEHLLLQKQEDKPLTKGISLRQEISVKTVWPH